MTAPTLSREAWLSLRGGFTLGSSEAAAAIGECPYRSPLELWAIKRGIVTPDDISEVRHVRLGRRLQPIVLDEWARATGAKVLTDREEVERLLEYDKTCKVLGWHEGEPLVQSLRHDWMVATLDGVAVDAQGVPVIVEAKAPGFRQAANWDDGEAPDHYRVQVMHALATVGWINSGVLVALIGGSEYREVQVTRNTDTERALVTLEAEFVRCLRDGSEPTTSGRSGESMLRALKLLHPDDNGETISLDGDLLSIHREYVALRGEQKKLADREAELKAELLRAIGPATYAALPDGSGMYSLKTTERDGYVAKASKYRTLKFQAAKAAKVSS